MRGWYECSTCRNQWSQVSFDTIPCPACGNFGVYQAVIGTPAAPYWYTADRSVITEVPEEDVGNTI